jgi:drug/metabolite transporter (DMT)-like permease
LNQLQNRAPETETAPTGALQPRTGYLRAALMMIGASALVAVTTLLAKMLGRGLGAATGGIEAVGLHPLQVSAGRFVFAFLALSLAAAWLRPSFAGARWRMHFTRSLLGWLGVSCIFAAAARMPLADATAISFLNPLVTMVLAIPLLGERVGPVRWLAAGISIAGALILIRPGTDAFQFAALIALSAALLTGAEAIVIKRLAAAEPPIRILIVNNAIGVVLSLSAAAFVWIAPSPAQWAMLALLGFTMAGAQALFIQAMKGAEASFVMPFFYATLVFAALYDLALFGEWPDMASRIGAAIIVAGGVLLAWREGLARRRAGSRRPS